MLAGWRWWLLWSTCNDTVNVLCTQPGSCWIHRYLLYFKTARSGLLSADAARNFECVNEIEFFKN